MVVVTGGAWQGKTEFARAQFGGKYEIIPAVQDLVAEWLEQGLDVCAEAEKLMRAHPDAVFIINEMGCGVVPIEKKDRDRREMTGRVACLLAKQAEEVYRLYCGIPTRIK